MRPAVLSISRERVLAPIRNAVLAHAGYGVIPVTNTESALRVLHGRHVCAVVVGHSVADQERRMLCVEAHRLGVPAIVLDPYEQVASDNPGAYVNPLDGPENLLDILADLVKREHLPCAVR